MNFKLAHLSDYFFKYNEKGLRLGGRCVGPNCFQTRSSLTHLTDVDEFTTMSLNTIWKGEL